MWGWFENLVHGLDAYYNFGIDWFIHYYDRNNKLFILDLFSFGRGGGNASRGFRYKMRERPANFPSKISWRGFWAQPSPSKTKSSTIISIDVGYWWISYKMYRTPKFGRHHTILRDVSYRCIMHQRRIFDLLNISIRDSFGLWTENSHIHSEPPNEIPICNVSKFGLNTNFGNN